MENKESIWHRRLGHLGIRSLKQLARDRMVNGFDFDSSKEALFCEPCAEGKHHRSPFPAASVKQSKQPLELVHSDVCGKIGTPSLSGAEYFLTFTDDYTHYSWVYVLKRKDEVFEKFQEWKALAERSSGQKLKVFRTDNGGDVKTYLADEGIQHELKPQVCLKG